MQNEQIISAVTAIFSGADEHNWNKVQQGMAEHVLLDYSSLSCSPAAVVPSRQIIDAWKAFLPGFDRTHHQLSDFQLQQAGNTAIVHFKGKADHFIGSDVWTVEGTYDAEVAATPSGYRATRLTFHLLHQSGNTSLPAQARQRLVK